MLFNISLRSDHIIWTWKIYGANIKDDKIIFIRKVNN